MATLPGFGTDMALPALADTATSLAVPVHTAGLTISSYMISFGLAPLAFGPLSDRYGRKPMVTLGTIIFIIASVGAPSTVAAGADCVPRRPGHRRGSHDTCHRDRPRRIRRYRCPPKTLEHRHGDIRLPIAAPMAGAALLDLANWRAIYASLAALGILLLIGLRLAPTTTCSRGRQPV